MVRQAVEGGVNMIQFRDTDMHGTERLHAAVKLREITESKALFIVNGDIDLAKKARADGIHFPEKHVFDADTEKLKENFILGKSVHSLEMAIKASSILFGKSTAEDLKSLDEDTFLSVFEGVPQFEINKADLSDAILDILAEKTKVFASKGEARRMIQSNAVSVNKEKITEDFHLSENDLLNGKYLLAQKGKKSYFLLILK